MSAGRLERPAQTPAHRSAPASAAGFREIADDDVEHVVRLGRVCGLTRPWNDPYLDAAVDPAAQGRGFGRRLDTSR